MESQKVKVTDRATGDGDDGTDCLPEGAVLFTRRIPGVADQVEDDLHPVALDACNRLSLGGMSRAEGSQFSFDMGWVLSEDGGAS